MTAQLTLDVWELYDRNVISYKINNGVIGFVSLALKYFSEVFIKIQVAKFLKFEKAWSALKFKSSNFLLHNFIWSQL